MKDKQSSPEPKRRRPAARRPAAQGDVARDAKAADQGPLESLGKAVSTPLTRANDPKKAPR